MPMYEFRCKKCGQVFEELFLSASSLTEDVECAGCGSKETEKLISASAVSVSASSSSQGCEAYPSGGGCSAAGGFG